MSAEAQTGFFCDFQVYTGRLSDEEGGVEHGERVVLQLSQHIEDHNYQVFCDNFFTTCEVLEQLLDSGIYACGTTRPMQPEFPNDLRGLKLHRGEFAFHQKGNVVATVWKDKRGVVMLSTMTFPESVTTVQRQQPDRTTKEVEYPVAIYNRYMNGVNRGDHLRKYYHVRLKCMKYYKYIFWFLYDVSITNAYIVWLLYDVPITNAYILSFLVPTTLVSVSTHTLKKFCLSLSHTT